MDKIISRGSHPHEMEFPSPVYTVNIIKCATIHDVWVSLAPTVNEEIRVEEISTRERTLFDVVLGLGGGHRYGMPNAIVAISNITFEDLKEVLVRVKESDDWLKLIPSCSPKSCVTNVLDRIIDSVTGSLCWKYNAYLDLGDDMPWSGSKGVNRFALSNNIIVKLSKYAVFGNEYRTRDSSRDTLTVLHSNKITFFAVSHIDGISLFAYRRFGKGVFPSADDELIEDEGLKEVLSASGSPVTQSPLIVLSSYRKIPGERHKRSCIRTVIPHACIRSQVKREKLSLLGLLAQLRRFATHGSRTVSIQRPVLPEEDKAEPVTENSLEFSDLTMLDASCEFPLARDEECFHSASQGEEEAAERTLEYSGERILLERVAREPLVTSEKSPDKKCVCTLFRPTTVEAISNLIPGFQMSAMSAQPLNCPEYNEGYSTLSLSSSERSAAIHELKMHCLYNVHLSTALSALIFASQDDGSIKIMCLDPYHFDFASVKQDSSKALPCRMLSLTISANELCGGEKKAKMVVNDMDVAESSNGIVLLTVCSDKTVRLALLPKFQELLALVIEQNKDTSEKKQNSIVRSILELNKEVLGISFNITSSSLRLGALFESGINHNEVDTAVLCAIVSYNSASKTSYMSLFMVETLVLAESKRYQLRNGSLVKFKKCFPIAKGAVTSLLPVSVSSSPELHKKLSCTFLVSTVDGLVSEIQAVRKSTHEVENECENLWKLVRHDDVIYEPVGKERPNSEQKVADFKPSYVQWDDLVNESSQSAPTSEGKKIKRELIEKDTELVRRAVMLNVRSSESSFAQKAYNSFHTEPISAVALEPMAEQFSFSFVVKNMNKMNGKKHTSDLRFSKISPNMYLLTTVDIAQRARLSRYTRNDYPMNRKSLEELLKISVERFTRRQLHPSLQYPLIRRRDNNTGCGLIVKKNITTDDLGKLLKLFLREYTKNINFIHRKERQNAIQIYENDVDGIPFLFPLSLPGGPQGNFIWKIIPVFIIFLGIAIWFVLSGKTILSSSVPSAWKTGF